MRNLTRALADKSKVPSHDVLTKAFRDFFSARAEDPGVITDFQARLLIVTWRHLKARQEELEPDDWQAVFSMENLEKILFILSEMKFPPKCCHIVLRLARYAYLELCDSHGSGAGEISGPALIAYVNLLSLNGNAEEARRVVQEFWGTLNKVEPSPWLTVMRGFAIEGEGYQIKKLSDELEKQGRKFDPATQEELIKPLIEHDFLNAVKVMYKCPVCDNLEPSLPTKEAVIKFAILKSETAWAKPILESLPPNPSPQTRDITLLWEAAHGKGAAEIAGTVTSWAAENPEMKSTLTISCVNNLIEFANSTGNPPLVAEFAALASQWGLEPDTQTRLLLLESRVQAGDVKGALECIRGIPELNEVALTRLPLMNKLIRMLCLCEQRDSLFEQTSSLLDPLFENNAYLEAETVAALTRMLLYRRDWDAVSELLRPILGSYDTEERAKIRNALVDFIMDPTRESEDVWDVYGLLQLAFPETSVKSRTAIMTSFFERGRSDLACLIFGHMRQAESLTNRPKPSTYAKCFRGLAITQDAKNLEVVHNMLKLDLMVDLTARIFNGLMLAYSACGMPEKAMEIFRQILQSEEGPSHKTIVIFFKVCQKHHDGTKEAMKMMKKVKLLEIEVDRELYTTFIEALAAQCEFNLAVDAIEKMQAETGFEPTRDT